MVPQEDRIALAELTATIVVAAVATGNMPLSGIADMIGAVHAALVKTIEPEPEAAVPVELSPAVPIRSSIKHDHIVCLEDGAKLKMLKRYLRTKFDMSPDEYRAKWSLPASYPMVAPAYAETRRALAVKIGLGRKRAEPTSAPAPAPKAKIKR